MGETEEVRSAIESRFEEARGRVRVQRERRLWLEVGPTEFRPIFDFVTGELGFDHLSTISGTDEGKELGFIYHLARPSGPVLSLMTRAAKGEEVRSVGDRFPGAMIYERELVDLFGARIAGLPPGPRYPLPDDWPACEYPLLKSWRREASPAPTPGSGATAEGADAGSAASAAPASGASTAAAAPAGTASPAAPGTPATEEAPHG